MRKISLIFGLLGLWLMLAAFSDSNGIFNVTIDPSWPMVESSDNPYSFTFRFQGDNSNSKIIMGATGPGSSLHQNILDMFKLPLSCANYGCYRIVQENSYTVVRQSCLYFEMRGTNPTGVAGTSLGIMCHVPTKSPSTPVLSVYIYMVCPSSTLTANSPVFWRAVQSISWGPSMQAD